jgi:integrase
MNWVRIGGAQNDGLFRHSETKVIKFRKYREGKGEIDRSCKTTVLEKARQVRDELMSELWGEKPLKKTRNSVGELWASWYQGMQETKSKKTAESIRTAWTNLKPYAENLFLDDITSEWWTNTYIPEKRSEENPRKGLDNSKRKFFNEWKWMSMFLKWCAENGKAPAQWVRPKLIDPDPERAEGVVYTKSQLENLDDEARLIEETFLCAGLEHFMRRSEIKDLTWDRVDLVKRVITLRAQDTKIRKPRRVPINEKLAHLFAQVRFVNEGSSPFVFPSKTGSEPMTFSEFRTMWGNWCERAGLAEGSRFHWLRHTGLTKATKRPGVNLVALCIVAGLSIEELQKTYLHYQLDDLRGVENLVSGAA